MLSFALAQAANAAVPVHVVRTDLKPLIRAAYTSPVQFAVLVPHAASTAKDGKWTVQGDRATWTYAVQIPTAVSMSFHATHVSLPASAALIVRGAKTTTSYRARDVHRGDVWSRIYPGDALQFSLTVAAGERGKVALSVVSLQAGYRSLGPGVSDHPYYRELKRQAAAASNTSCVTNYECQVNASNTPPGQATVALVIGNLFTCSGSLINDVPLDNTPYILTARHCENGEFGGGNPAAASNVVVYWDAATPCGATLGSIYDGDIPTQTGAQTVVEQQDAWLIQLDANPVVSDAQFAGFDASGGPIQGGYTIHHAEGYDKQFVEWSGQAYAVQESDVLTSTYVSNFWETVNQLGNIAPGASGSGLFDQNNHLVGTLTLGRNTGDPSGYGSCPVQPPPAPNGSNGVADFTSLSAVWDSTADATSSTGSTTLKSVLDPANSGALVVSSLPAAPIAFSASPISLQTGSPAQLTWRIASGTQCSPSGGLPGDGWAGTLPAAGTQSVTEQTGGNVTYKITCGLQGGGSVSSSVDIAWNGSVPFVQVYLPRSTVWATRPAQITWTSNVSPCAVSGGGLSLTGLPSSGSTTATQSSPGDVTYTVSCGSGPAAASSYSTETYVTPSLVFVANGTDILLGQLFALGWLTYADTCIPSGGAPNDGWANNSFAWTTQIFYPRVTSVGTYTYTLNCSAGPLSVQQSISVTFDNNGSYVTATVSPTTTTLTDSPADYVTVNWTSNLTSCAVNSTPVLGMGIGPPAPIPNFNLPEEIIAPNAPGTYTLSVTCSGVGAATVTSVPMTVTILPPPPPTATLSLNPSTVAPGQNFTISWSSTNALDCAETGGAPGSIWGAAGSNNFGDPPTGSGISSANELGVFTFGITCKSIDPNQGAASASATLTVSAPTVTLTANAISLTQGQSLTLTWASTLTTGCVASGGGANGTQWTGSLETSGTVTQSATTLGTFTYTITCTGTGGQQVQAYAGVTVTAASGGGGGGGGGGGHGGGGGLGLLELGSLAALAGLRRLPRRQVRQ